jgi:hypothetical protein
MIDSGTGVDVAVADGQRELITRAIQFFFAGPEFDEIHESHSMVLEPGGGNLDSW